VLDIGRRSGRLVGGFHAFGFAEGLRHRWLLPLLQRRLLGVASLALGVQLRDYAFDRYKTKRK
jgi:hypothetical protein